MNDLRIAARSQYVAPAQGSPAAFRIGLNDLDAMFAIFDDKLHAYYESVQQAA